MTKASLSAKKPETQSDQLFILIEEVKLGNSEAFSKIYDLYSSALLGIAFNILKDNSEAEDVLQVTFVKIWKSIHSFSNSKGSFFTWMLNITRNTAIDRYRQINRQNSVSIEQSGIQIKNSFKSGLKINTNTIGLKELVGSLPEKYQIIIDNIFFQGYTQQETSDNLCIPLGTVKSRTRFALNSIRAKF